MSFRGLLLLVSALALSGCFGRLTRGGGGGLGDGGSGTDGASGVDLGRRDSGPGTDSGTPPRDLGTPPPVDMGGPPPPVDMGPPPPVDMGASGCAGGPLALPIAGCMPRPVPDTGDPYADCVARINQFRHDCQCLPPLARWTAGEACADMDAMYDQQHMSAHAGFSGGVSCSGGYGQNECPGWLGWHDVPSTISNCLQQMWDEGPGDFYGPPAHGHYINMSSTSFSSVACGFYTSGGQTTAVQNFM